MKIITNLLPYLLFSLITLPLLITPLTIKSKTTTNTNTNSNTNNFNTNQIMSTLNLSLQKAFLSTEDINITNIYPKLHKISTESIFFDEKNQQIYETGIMKTTNIILKKNYPTNKVLKALPLGAYNVKGLAKCGTNFYQFAGIKNKILRFTYPNLDFLTPINMDFDLKNGEGLATLSEDFLIASNGTDEIFILDCKNDLNVIKTFSVKNTNEEPLLGIKDMVVVGEFIYAIRGNDNRIFKINPATGMVVKFYNMGNLINFELKTNSLSVNDVSKGAILSGIGYDKIKKMFIITGKNWGHYYEVDLK